jgi:hypothetical protein
VPAISPIYGNTPSFLTASVGTGGVLRDVEEFSYLHGAWRDEGGMPSLGVVDFTAPQLIALQNRLAGDASLRATFDRLYEGGARSEIDERNWRVYWCAATAFGSTPFRTCDASGGFSLVTGRGLVALVFAGTLVVLAAGSSVWWLRRRSVRRQAGHREA